MKLLRVLILASFLAIVVPSSGLNSRKLEDGSLTPGVEKNCSGSGCDQEVPPSPPPPRHKHHPPPPPSDDSGGSSNYPPNAPASPSQGSVYVPAPPGYDLYPVTVSPYHTNNAASPGLATFCFSAFIGSLMLYFLALS